MFGFKNKMFLNLHRKAHLKTRSCKCESEDTNSFLNRENHDTKSTEKFLFQQ